MLLSFLLLPMCLPAQQVGDSESAPVIRAIEVHRFDIFDPSEATGIIPRLANGLHVTTREFVVRRELLFRVGQPYDSARVAETERNLRALGLFRRVVIDSVHTDSGLTVRVSTHDGWSTKADVRFRSTGDEVEYGIGFTEENLAGTATLASIRFRKTPDRTRLVFGFLQPRFIFRTMRLGVEYEDRSDGRIIAAQIGKPFYSLSQRESLLLFFDDRDERILRFFNGEDDPSDSLRRRHTLLRMDGALALRAGRAGYTRLGFVGQVRREDFVPAGLTGVVFPSTTTGAIGPTLEWRRARFVVTEGFLGFGREQDVDESTLERVGLLAAPAAFGYER
ncbi:MAG: POTRA domain-containing protein, partial [Gemmatimonadales bacterium]